MDGLRRRFRAVLAVGVIIAVSAVAPASAAPTASPPHAAEDGPIAISVTDVSPNSPAVTDAKRQLDFSLRLTNSSSSPISKVVIHGNRTVPITSQRALAAQAADPTPPADATAGKDLPTRTVTVPAHGAATVEVVTTTSRQSSAGICLCANAIYPVYFIASYRAAGQAYAAHAVTYFPAFVTSPSAKQKLQVSWVWPLLDRPHRFTRPDVFVDDDLGAEVAPGGRLDDLLATLDRLSTPVAVTVLVDPELISELVAMSDGYRVETGSGLVAGRYAGQARDWLTEFSRVLRQPGIDVACTPFADPAIDSLTAARMTWSKLLDHDATAEVTRVLGGTPQFDLVWPVGSVAHRSTLATVAQSGATTVLLKDRAFTEFGRHGEDLPPTALSEVHTRSGALTAAVTSTSLENRVRAVILPAAGSNGLTALPRLLAQLALAVEDGVNHKSSDPLSVVLTPPRVAPDLDPAIAAQVISETSSSIWSRPVSLRTSVSTVPTSTRGTLRPHVHPQRMNRRTAGFLQYVKRTVPLLGDLYANHARYLADFGGFPSAVQRAESSQLLDTPAQAATWAHTLRETVQRTRAGVTLVRPTVGRYTLTSKDADLPVRVENDLGTAVRVDVTLTGDGGLSAPVVERRIPAHSATEVRVPTHVDQVRLIQVSARLTTPGGRLTLGQPISLTVNSTALGTIGIVITVVAGAVLVLALLVRFVRRMRDRRRPPPTDPVPDPTPAVAPTAS